jgi:hypothetical protein
VNTSADGSPVDAGCSELPGDCTLREALAASNASAAVDNTIEFDFDGSTIELVTPLPDIVDKVTIDGTNAQGGEVEVVPFTGVPVTDGLVLATGSDGSRIQDLRMSGFDADGPPVAAIRVQSSSNLIYTNSLSDSDYGVVLSGGEATGNRIGASDGRGNSIWGFTSAGVLVDTAGTGNLVQSNTIGLDGEGAPDAGTNGIVVRTTEGTIVGDDAPPDGLDGLVQDNGNVVVGADAEGIQLDGESTSGTIVAANLVGTDSEGTDFGNGIGIDVQSFAFDNQLGPGNVIAFNGDGGIQVQHGGGNRIVANSVHSNGGLGINLFNNGNNELPAATIASVTSGNIEGTVDGVPDRNYFLEIFTNDSCTGAEGETFVGYVTVQDGAFNQDLYPLSLTEGTFVTTTLTDSTTDDTSEFSNCVTVEAGGGGGATEPPVLSGAIPNADGPTLGVAGVWDSGSTEAGQSFDVTFYSVPSCTESATKTLLGSSSGLDVSLVTNVNGIGAFALDGLTNVPVGTLVTATVNGGEGPSDISNCVVADRNNVSWPTAFELAGDATDNANFLRSSGQARWFKFPVLPNSRVDVTARNLPADYDLVVFKDIQAKYDELVGGAAAEVGPNLAIDDLNRQGAEAPVDLFNTSQYNPSSWDPTNWKPDLNDDVYSPAYSPTEYSPTEYSAAFTSPTEYSPTEYSPTEYSPTEYSPTEYSPTEYSADQFSRDEWATFNPADPRAFSAAQTASLVAISSGPGTGDESVSVNTWNNTGSFYVRVQGKNGSFDPDTPFTLQVSSEGNLCSGVADQASSPTAAGSGRKTVILVDSSRLTLGGALSSKLATFAARPEVAGAVVDVNGFPTVASLNAQADAHPGCPYAKNLVASAVKEIVDAYRATNPIEYVVVVGDDDVIPFFRYPDPALLGNERLYVPPVGDNTASQASLRLGYVLSDDFLASSTSVSLHGNAFPVPDLAIGRLVETPAEIEGMLDAYLGANGSVSPSSSLVTGYDFLTDAADEIKDVLAPKIPGSNDETLITNQGVSPGTVTLGDNPDRTHSWTAADLRRELLSQRHDVIFLAGHFSANDALAADYRTNVLSTELPTASANLANAIVFSAGCHAGYNIVNEHAIQGATEPLDWAQAFARKQTTLIAGTGYQYGDTDFLAHSERLYTEFARQLGGAVGSSLLRSKQVFLEESPGLSALDEKTLLQTTLFGLPMLNVNVAPSGPAVEPPIASPAPVGPGPGADLGLEAATVTLPMATTQDTKSLNGLGSDNPASWFEGPNGVSVKPMQPILPLESLNVTVPGKAMRGVGFRGGAYQQETGTVPLTAAPATELRGIHAPFFTDVFFPQQPWTPNYFGALGGSGRTQLHVTPVQHRSESPRMTRRKYTGMSFKLFYSTNTASYCGNRDTPAPCDPGQVAVTPALAAPPTITGVDTSYSGTTLTFSVRVLGDNVAGIQEVWVTYTDPPEGNGSASWIPVDLEQDEDDPTLWTGTLTTSTPGALFFMVHAANGVGRVTTDDNVGALYRHGAIPGPLEPGEAPPPSTSLDFTAGPPSSVNYAASFSVTVDLDGTGSCSVGPGKLVRVAFGGAGLPATTDGSGTATVALRAALTPGTYPLTATFAGDAACASSDVSANVVVNQQPTSLTLAFPAATLVATTSPPTPLHQRNVTFVLRKTGVTEVYTAKTDPLGRVEIPQSLLQSLPAGTYTVDAYFNGVNLPGVIQLAPNDVDYGHSEAHATREVWPFDGFFGHSSPPAFNTAKAGSTMPVKFSLGVNRGLGVFATGYPKVGTISCATGNPIGGLALAEGVRFRYDTRNRHYTYDWKTQKDWTGCRQLVFRFTDGTERVLWFRF